jgi:hypothetical protein
VFDLNASDWLIDRIADEFEEFFGMWQSARWHKPLDFASHLTHTV